MSPHRKLRKRRNDGKGLDNTGSDVPPKRSNTRGRRGYSKQQQRRACQIQDGGTLWSMLKRSSTRGSRRNVLLLQRRRGPQDPVVTHHRFLPTGTSVENPSHFDQKGGKSTTLSYYEDAWLPPAGKLVKGSPSPGMTTSVVRVNNQAILCLLGQVAAEVSLVVLVAGRKEGTKTFFVTQLTNGPRRLPLRTPRTRS